MNFNSGSFPIGRISGIPIRLHYLFLVFLVLQVLGSLYYGKWQALLFFILMGPVLLVTVLIHEYGHCWATRRVGGVVEGILLWPLGGLAFIGHNKGPKKDMFIAAAGPATHVPMIAIWLLGLLGATYAAYGTTSISLAWPYVQNPKTLGVAVCVGAVIMNISLLLFNLFVPAYPLDGGRILVDSLLSCGVSEPRTALITVGVTVPIALGIIVLGALSIQIVTILVGLWVLWAAWELFSCYRKGQLAQHPMFAFTSAQHEQQAAEAAAAMQPGYGYGGPGPYQTQPGVVAGYPVSGGPAGPGRV